MPRKPVKKTHNHPKYEAMIGEAIIMLKDKTGSSVPAISKYVLENYDVPEATFKTQLRLALKRGVENETLIKNRSSYRLDPAQRAKLKKKLGISSKKRSRSRSRSPTPKKKERSRSESPAKRSRSKSPAPKRSRSKSPARKKKPTTTPYTKTKPKPRTTHNSKNAGVEKGTRTQPKRKATKG